jgi:hypothetical protein
VTFSNDVDGATGLQANGGKQGDPYDYQSDRRLILKITRAKAMFASALTIGAVLLVGAAPAWANQADAFYITGANGGTRYFLIDDVTLQVHTAMIPTIWNNVNGKMWGSSPTYEWKQDGGPNWCWTWEGSGQSVILQPCLQNDKSQLWWQRTNGQFVNWQATVDASNSDQCLNAIHLQDGSLLNVIGCKSKSQSGWWDQYWTSVS